MVSTDDRIGRLPAAEQVAYWRTRARRAQDARRRARRRLEAADTARDDFRRLLTPRRPPDVVGALLAALTDQDLVTVDDRPDRVAVYRLASTIRTHPPETTMTTPPPGLTDEQRLAWTDGYTAGRTSASLELLPKIVAVDFRAGALARGIPAARAAALHDALRADAFLTEDGTAIDTAALSRYLDTSAGVASPQAAALPSLAELTGTAAPAASDAPAPDDSADTDDSTHTDEQEPA